MTDLGLNKNTYYLAHQNAMGCDVDYNVPITLGQPLMMIHHKPNDKIGREKDNKVRKYLCSYTIGYLLLV